MICDVMELLWGGGRQSIQAADDDGVYYVRQLDAADRVGDFEGLVWFGQQLADAPRFANVFIGRLLPKGGVDEHGFDICRWNGMFFDVPKGTLCGSGDLDVEGFVNWRPEVPGCDFPEFFLRKVRSDGFGANFWNVEASTSRCWADAPPLPPRLLRALRTSGFPATVDALSSAPLPAGFASTDPTNMTGTWRGDDGGTYYVRHFPKRSMLGWYAESPDARPGVPFARGALPPIPAAGWAHVFGGENVATGKRTIIEGMWADVPRGSTRDAGRLSVEVRTPCLMDITPISGRFGGRRLWRVDTIDVAVSIPTLTIQTPREGADEPLLYLNFFKLDGDTIDADSLGTSSATVSSRDEIYLGVGRGAGGVAIPAADGTWNTTLTTIRSSTECDTGSSTMIGVQAYAIEVDDANYPDFRRDRHGAWISTQRRALDSRVRTELPRPAWLEGLREAARRIHVRYLGPWEGWPFGDSDDPMGGDVVWVSFAELRAAAAAGIPATRTLEFPRVPSSPTPYRGPRYTARVSFTPASRLNPRCSG